MRSQRLTEFGLVLRNGSLDTEGLSVDEVPSWDNKRFVVFLVLFVSSSFLRRSRVYAGRDTVHACRTFYLKLRVLRKATCVSGVAFRLLSTVIVHLRRAERSCLLLFTDRPLGNVLKQLRVGELVNGLHQIIAKPLPRSLVRLRFWHVTNLIDDWSLEALTVGIDSLRLGQLIRHALCWRVVDVAQPLLLFRGPLLAIKGRDLCVDDSIFDALQPQSLLRWPLLGAGVTLLLAHLRLLDGRESCSIGKITCYFLHVLFFNNYFSQKFT